MDSHHLQAAETNNAWPGFSDMFLVLFVILLVAYGTYTFTQQEMPDSSDNVLIEIRANELLRLVYGPATKERYRSTDDQDAIKRKPNLALALQRAAERIKRLTRTDHLEMELNDEALEHFDTHNYRDAIKSFARVIQVRDYENFIKKRPDLQLADLVAEMAPGIGKIQMSPQEKLQKAQTELEETKAQLAAIRKELQELKHANKELAQLMEYKRKFERYKEIFGDLSELDGIQDLRKRWEKAKTLDAGDDKILLAVDKQFQEAMSKYRDITEGVKEITETPQTLLQIMQKLSESIMGGQFDIVNSVLSESEVKFRVARPDYGEIDELQRTGNLNNLFGGNKAFATQKQWQTAYNALLQRVVLGYDQTGAGGETKHIKGIVDMLKEHPKSTVVVNITGYTDSDGDNERNNDLGMRRAVFITEIIKQILKQMSADQMQASDLDRVEFRNFSAGEFGLLPRIEGESEQDYKARCRRIDITIKVGPTAS